MRLFPSILHAAPQPFAKEFPRPVYCKVKNSWLLHCMENMPRRNVMPVSFRKHSSSFHCYTLPTGPRGTVPDPPEQPSLLSAIGDNHYGGYPAILEDTGDGSEVQGPELDRTFVSKHSRPCSRPSLPRKQDVGHWRHSLWWLSCYTPRRRRPQHGARFRSG